MNEYWQEDNAWHVPVDVIDLSYRLVGKTIPVDHAWKLSQSITKLLPWFADEELAALHLIHVAESANGWQRPEGADDILHLSRRTKLSLRIPICRLEDAKQIRGKTLELGEGLIEVADCKVKPLSKSTIIFSRYLDMKENVKESVFLKSVRQELQQMNIPAKKMLCGRIQVLRRPCKDLITRSLMIADLHIRDSIRLQQVGLGANRKMGCGIFIAHKSIDAV